MIVRIYRRVEAYFTRVGNETDGDAAAVAVADVLLQDVVGVEGLGVEGLEVGVGIGGEVLGGVGGGLGVGIGVGGMGGVGNAASDLDEVLQDVEADTQITQDLLSSAAAAGNVGFLQAVR